MFLFSLSELVLIVDVAENAGLRITTVHLETKLMSMLDEYTQSSEPLPLQRRNMGLRLKPILLKAPSNLSIHITRDAIIRCLMVYLGESTDHLLKEYDDADEDGVSQDLAMQKMKIYRAEGPEDVGIVI